VGSNAFLNGQSLIMKVDTSVEWHMIVDDNLNGIVLIDLKRRAREFPVHVDHSRQPNRRDSLPCESKLKMCFLISVVLPILLGPGYGHQE
jgi:hypothetical protein